MTGWFLLQYLLDDIALIVSGDFRPAARVAPPAVSVVLAMELRLVVSSAATALSVINKQLYELKCEMYFCNSECLHPEKVCLHVL